MREIVGSSPVRGFALPNAIEHVHRHHPLRNVLAFAGRTIDDVVNCPIARREVILYHRLGLTIRRLAEAQALEQQWNPLGTLGAPQSIHKQ